MNSWLKFKLESFLWIKLKFKSEYYLGINIGGPVQAFPPFVFFLAGTIFFEASLNQNKYRQMSNKERDDFDNAHQKINCTCQSQSIILFKYIDVNCH